MNKQLRLRLNSHGGSWLLRYSTWTQMKGEIQVFKYPTETKTAHLITYNVIRTAKNGYNETIIKEAGADTRKLWSILNEVIDRKQCRHKMPNIFIIDGVHIRNKKNIANAFNAYFASIWKEMADQLPDEAGFEEYLPWGSSIQPKEFIPADEEEIGGNMKNQIPKLSCRINTINNEIVKICH